ncbi:MAG TPA: DUF3108 domain-containing protein [Opitutus sp.]|nr:DUF3108 domain-containing protein [Opitutus sp.]
MKLLIFVLAASVAVAAPPDQPKSKSETLHFTVNWPSGLSLGEGQLISAQTPDGWSFSMNVEAAIPAFAVAESAKSSATADFCSVELEKTGTRGKREITETTTFDASKMIATRETKKGGGKSEMRITACARDALTFLQFMRRELAAGKLPQAQPVYYGAPYQTRVQYTGTTKIVANGEAIDADKLTATFKGPASEFAVDMWFARDAARTPVKAQIPVTVGKFTVEFSR